MKLKSDLENQYRDTGLAIILILLIAAHFAKQFVLIYPAIIVLILTMIYPKFFRPFSRLWFSFSSLVGTYASKVVLSVVYFSVVVPIGLLRNMLGTDLMKKNLWRTGHDSVFIERNKSFKSKDIEKPY